MTPSTSEYKLLMCLRRASLTSHIAFRLQLDSPLKLRTRFGPQYPHPTTPTLIGSFISSRSNVAHFLFPVRNQKPITFQQAQQAAFEVEGVPRYDHLFVIMLENKGTKSILNSPY